MLKSLHTHQNEIFLTMLRHSREAQRLRQLDLAVRLGRGQAIISRAERGVRRLDVIELRAWLQALEIDFRTFMVELDERLQGLDPPAQIPGARAPARQRKTESGELLDAERQAKRRSFAFFITWL
jgi:transcriptional regulator with XRE-family HTH domain